MNTPSEVNEICGAFKSLAKAMRTMPPNNCDKPVTIMGLVVFIAFLQNRLEQIPDTDARIIIPSPNEKLNSPSGVILSAITPTKPISEPTT